MKNYVLCIKMCFGGVLGMFCGCFVFLGGYVGVCWQCLGGNNKETAIRTTYLCINLRMWFACYLLDGC